MAGSYRHIVDEDNNLLPPDELLIDDPGDAYEGFEELYYLVNILAKWNKTKINDAYIEYLKTYKNIDGKDLDFAKRNPIFPDAGFNNYYIPRKFLFKPTGDYFELDDNGFVYTISDPEKDIVPLCVPLWVVKNSNDWEEIDK